MKESRVYNQIIELNPENVKDFWNQRTKVKGVNSILLGKQNNEKENIIRNQKEKELLLNLLKETSKNSTILDIGCGIGRWAQNLIDKIKYYDGIDYIDDFILDNRKKFKNHANIKFHTMAIENIKQNTLLKKYDNIIATGILMYLNDTSLINALKNMQSFKPKYIYIQETICTLEHRLSLNNFYSNELQVNYSAIYRTKEEYESFFKKYLNNYKIKNNDFLLINNTETSPMYWFLEFIQ